MYGILLRLDAGRQQRVGTDPLKKLLKPEVYDAIQQKRSKLNASTDVTNPFAPTLVRPSFYPEYFRATEIRTLYWMVKNHPEMHGLTRVFIDTDSRIVFEFDETSKEIEQSLDSVLKIHGHFEFTEQKVSSNRISYCVTAVEYAPMPQMETGDDE